MSISLFIAALVCTSGAPRTAWLMNEGGIRRDVLCSAVELEDGDFMAAGYSASYSTDDYDGYLVRIGGETGELLWFTTRGGLNDDRLYDIGILPDGNCIACGETSREDGSGGSDGWQKAASCMAAFAHVGPTGNLISDETLTSGLDTRVECVVASSSGSVLASGCTEDLEFETQEIFVWELTLDPLERHWSLPVGGSEDKACLDMIEAMSGDIVIVGGTASYGGGDMNALAVRLERTDSP